MKTRISVVTQDTERGDPPCATCRKHCLTIPKNGCAWWEPKEEPNPVRSREVERRLRARAKRIARRLGFDNQLHHHWSVVVDAIRDNLRRAELARMRREKR